MDAVPAKLKPAEVGRFIHRANQLRHVKPAMTYWCASRSFPPSDDAVITDAARPQR